MQLAGNEETRCRRDDVTVVDVPCLHSSASHLRRDIRDERLVRGREKERIEDDDQRGRGEGKEEEESRGRGREGEEARGEGIKSQRGKEDSRDANEEERQQSQALLPTRNRLSRASLLPILI